MLPLLNNWTTSRLRSGVSCLRAPMTDLLDESCLSSKISVKSWLPQNIPSLSLCLEYRCGFLGQAENSICSKTLHFRESAEAKISSPTKESRDVSESLSLLRFVRLQACELPPWVIRVSFVKFLTRRPGTAHAGWRFSLHYRSCFVTPCSQP